MVVMSGIFTTFTSSSILSTTSIACVEREAKYGLNSYSSIVTSDANPVAVPTFFFATSTAMFACSSSVIVPPFSAVPPCASRVQRPQLSLLVFIKANAESSLASTGAASKIGTVGFSTCLVCSAKHALPVCITMSCAFCLCPHRQILKSLLRLAGVLPFPITRCTRPASPFSSASKRALPFPVVSIVSFTFSRVGSPCTPLDVRRGRGSYSSGTIPCHCNSACFHAHGKSCEDSSRQHEEQKRT